MNIKKYILMMLAVFFCETSIACAPTPDYNEKDRVSCLNYLGRILMPRLQSFAPDTFKQVLSIYSNSMEQQSSLPSEPGKPAYGRNMNVSPAILCNIVQHLQTISEVNTRLGQKTTVMEIATGCGNLSVLLPMFIDCDLIFVEQNQKALNKCKERIDALFGIMRLPCRNITFICEDCINLPVKRPDLEEEVDSVIALNLQHFFGPNKDQEFYRCLSFLMKPNAQAFLSAQNVAYKDGDALSKFLSEPQEGVSSYPGFVEQHMLTYERLFLQGIVNGKLICTKPEGTLIAHPFFIDPIKRPALDKNHEVEYLSGEKISSPDEPSRVTLTIDGKTETFYRAYIGNIGEFSQVFLTTALLPRTRLEFYAFLNSLPLSDIPIYAELRIRSIYNYFTPETYRRAVAASGTPLHVLEALYTNEFGIRNDTDPLTQHFTFAILEKTPPSTEAAPSMVQRKQPPLSVTAS